MIPFILALYITNSVLLSIHEMEAGAWAKNNFIKLPNDIRGFIIFHFPLFFLLSFGLVELYHNRSLGYTMSSFLSLGGILFFMLNFYKNKLTLGKPFSSQKVILLLIVSLSLFQFFLTFYFFPKM